MLISALKSVGEEALVVSVQGLCCGLLFFISESLALSVQGSVQWIDVLQTASGEALALSAHDFVL